MVHKKIIKLYAAFHFLPLSVLQYFKHIRWLLNEGEINANIKFRGKFFCILTQHDFKEDLKHLISSFHRINGINAL